MAEVAIPRHVPGDFTADRGAAAEAAARTRVRQPMVMHSRTPDGGSTSRCEAKPDTSAPRTPRRARIAGDPRSTQTVLPGSSENHYHVPQNRGSSGEFQLNHLTREPSWTCIDNYCLTLPCAVQSRCSMEAGSA